MRSDFRFFHRLRVRYSEIDGQGIVFNAHYLTYLDVAITEYFRHLGLDYNQLAREGKMDMVLVKTTLEFKAPAFFDEVLEIGVRITHIGNKSFTVDFEIYKENSEVLVLKAETVYVNYNTATRSTQPVPGFFRSIVENFEKLPQ
ncbi:MAG: acyl-CoA thioester hydrolase [Thermoanaerobacter sp.]|jgi:acyl-CoA thioester hydrolase|uniref:acyl-CoA thioesterase n=1 Tax=Desulfofundulus thermocisternus TaxID=42471 RepID=UPI0005551651|nr:thioesterase family protein [Desulfofundulus thermocisternus]MDK2887626.1 acyl-CoA thioester hydrolase [Thermoanaerobacter sp.]